MAIEKDKLNEFIEKMKAEVKELGLGVGYLMWGF